MRGGLAGARPPLCLWVVAGRWCWCVVWACVARASRCSEPEPAGSTELQQCVPAWDRIQVRPPALPNGKRARRLSRVQILTQRGQLSLEHLPTPAIYVPVRRTWTLLHSWPALVDMRAAPCPWPQLYGRRRSPIRPGSSLPAFAVEALITSFPAYACGSPQPCISPPVF